MTTMVGLSSGSAAGLGATELARLVRSLGGTAVDVRAGKGHGWQREGLAGLRAAGVEVCFVGVGTVLGDGAAPTGDERAFLEPGVPVKVFAAAGCLAADRIGTTLAQVRELAELVGGPELVLVETHHGYASVPELVELVARAGIRVLLDTMGLARIHPDPVAAAATLAPWTSHAQVKGFDWSAPGTSRHRPLAASCAAETRAVLAAAGALRAVTVESKAEASLAEDVALLRSWYPIDTAPEAGAEALS